MQSDDDDAYKDCNYEESCNSIYHNLLLRLFLQFVPRTQIFNVFMQRDDDDCDLRR